MNCENCGGKYIEKSGDYELFDRYVGKIIIHGITYYQCDNCNNILYSEEMAQAIEIERNNRIQSILKQYPIGDFINAFETASLLGISRQALHKHRRINHGFIYQTKFAGLNVYLKTSVLKFKEIGDGRFPLYPAASYSKDIIAGKRAVLYPSFPRIIVPDQPQYQSIIITHKESIYAN